MTKVSAVLTLAIFVGACTPHNDSESVSKVTSANVAASAPVTVPTTAPTPQVTAIKPESNAQVKAIAREYGVTESKVHDTASRAAELSGGNASKQDMLDALKAARGE